MVRQAIYYSDILLLTILVPESPITSQKNMSCHVTILFLKFLPIYPIIQNFILDGVGGGGGGGVARFGTTCTILENAKTAMEECNFLAKKQLY